MIRQLDLYENHGFIPKGQVCSNVEEHQTFVDFCNLALYRCTKKKYFVKRVPCPSEIRKTPLDIQIIDQEVKLGENIPSPKRLDNILSASAAATSTIDRALFEKLEALFSTPAPEVHSPLLTVPATSTTPAESYPEPPMNQKPAKGSFFKILVESTSQLFNHAVITTPKPPPKSHPIGLSVVVSTEVHTRGESSVELHPFIPSPQMASPKLHTISTPVASTTGLVSKVPLPNSAPPTTLELLASITSRAEMQSSQEHTTASEGLTAEETSPGLTITKTGIAAEDIVSESSILMGAAITKSPPQQVISSIAPTIMESSSEHTTAATTTTIATSTSAIALPGGLLPTEAWRHQLTAGTPLSDAEYENFFRVIKNPRKIGHLCLFRTVFGCQQPVVHKFDLYENHGIIPKGQVCSNLEEYQTFPDFCTFALYRCTRKKYFVKRVLCPSDIRKPSDQKVEPHGSVSSPKIVNNMLNAAATATSTTPKFFLERFATLFSKTATESVSEPPVESVTSKGSFFKLRLASISASVAHPLMTTVTTTSKVCPVTQTSTTASSEADTTKEPFVVLHPDVVLSIMASPERNTISTPGTSTKESLSKVTNSVPATTSETSLVFLLNLLLSFLLPLRLL
ncbi:uncharacterized protein LOC134299167 isoform X2 [Anolis carolinensis]